ELGRIDPGAAMPLCATDRYGRGVTDRDFTTTADVRLRITEDVTPVMMVTTVVQTRRDCLFYIARRRAGAQRAAGARSPPRWAPGRRSDPGRAAGRSART